MNKTTTALLIICLLIHSTSFAQDFDGLGELDGSGDLEMEITGKVVDIKLDSLKVKPEGQWRPKVGDPVRILIGSGVVREVTEDGIVVDLQNGGAAVNMVAAIRSPNADLKTSLSKAETPSTPAAPPIIPAAPPVPTKPKAPEQPKWASLSADENYNMGAKFYQGNKVAQDYGQALEWFQHAVDKGHIGALNDIGVMHELGQGVPKNPAKAVEWYRKAIDQNYALGHYNLGRAYETGNGIGKDYSEALKSYRRAARMGEKNAQNKLSSRGLRW